MHNVSSKFNQPPLEIANKILHLPISDPEIAKIEIHENHDPIVCLGQDNVRIVSTDDSRFGEKRIPTSPPSMREPILNMLKDALKNLQEDIGIAVFEGYRPLETQEKYFNKKLEELKAKDSSLSNQDAITEASKWVTNPNGALIPPHSTGGAIDVQLFKIHNPAAPDNKKIFSFLDVGKFGAIFGFNPHPATLSENELSETQWNNRQMLLTAMVKAGFVNYGMEHWHYSAGDQAACFVKGETVAKYSGKVPS